MKIWASLCLCFLIPISHRSKCISFTNSLNVPARWQEELFWSRTLCAALCIGKIFCIQRTLWGTPNELKFEGFRHPYILPPCNYLKKYKYFFFQHFFLDTRKKKILPGWGKKKKLSSPLKIKGLNLEFKYIGLFKKNLLVERPTLPASPSSYYLFNENYRKAFYFNMWKQLASLFLGDKPANMNPSLFSNNQPSALHPHPLVFIF